MSANSSTAEPHIKGVLAANLRRLRIARRLSLSELARATSIGKATLSEIENGRANPTVGTLDLLAAALRVRIGELLEEPPLGEIRVVRGARGQKVDASGRRAVDEFAVDGALALALLELPARTSREAEPGAPGSREELYVVEGTLIAGPVERVTELGPGDYASFPADAARFYEAGRTAARALVLAHGGS